MKPNVGNDSVGDVNSWAALLETVSDHSNHPQGFDVWKSFNVRPCAMCHTETSWRVSCTPYMDNTGDPDFVCSEPCYKLVSFRLRLEGKL